MAWIVGVVAVGVLGWAVWVYNRLVGLRQRADNAWSDIDAQLKRRHDLVPPLVETVKGYARHERATLEEVIARRAAVPRDAGPDAGVAESENLLARSLRGLFAVAEDYPELRASERFGRLQEQLAEIEDALQDARRYYNAVVRDLNVALARFPDLIVARTAGFRRREFFELENPLEGRAVKVELDD